MQVAAILLVDKFDCEDGGRVKTKILFAEAGSRR